jgi:GSCFA family
MIFRTILPIQKAAFDIDYQTPILSIGSCFTENIGVRLNDLRLPICINPFGIVYNPISMSESINYLMTDKYLTENDIFQYNGLYHSWQHHGRFSSPDKAKILRGVNSEIIQARQILPKAKVLMLTLGTAHVFLENKSYQVVANCHKVPASYFEQKRLSVEEVVENLTYTFDSILRQNIDCQIIITVSPIRHIKDGFIENQRSKATLLLAAEALCHQYANVHYFPAYEILMDDLRDYRFYEADMIHPNSQAIDYIWQQFLTTYFSEKTQNIMREVSKLNAMQKHRPLHSDTEGYHQFVDKLEKYERALKIKYPFIEF